MKITPARITIIYLISALVILAACTPPAPTLETANLGSLAYTLDGETYQLTNGEYHTSNAPDTTPELALTLGDAVYGELDDTPIAAVILDAVFYGESNFSYLALVQMTDGQPANTAALMIGEWVMINSVTIAENQIMLDIIAPAASEMKCCETRNLIQTYALRDGALVLIRSVVRARHG